MRMRVVQIVQAMPRFTKKATDEKESKTFKSLQCASQTRADEKESKHFKSMQTMRFKNKS